MTPQEQQMIDGLVERIRNTPVQDKDLEADRYLQEGLGGDPNALYILAQTVLVQQYGLQQAQAQLQQLQEALEEARQHVQQNGGFLSKIFGGGGGPQQAPPYQPVNAPSYAAPQYGTPGYGAPGYGPGAPSMVYGQPVGYAPQGGGFLRGAMQTAAGVAMGEMAFEGMESLFHGFGGGMSERPGESVVNNYYDDAGSNERRVDDGNFYNPSNDASRQDASNTSGQGFADTGDGAGAETAADGLNDPNGFVDSSAEGADNGGFDDSGDGSDSNFDDGSGSF